MSIQFVELNIKHVKSGYSFKRLPIAPGSRRYGTKDIRSGDLGSSLMTNIIWLC